VGPGTGVFYDLAPHLIDHTLQLLGKPAAVSADIRTERDNAIVDDAFDLTFYYSGGLRALLRATMVAPVTRPRFIVHGTAGAYVKHSFDVQEPKLRAGRLPWNETPTEEEQRENSGVLSIVMPDGGMRETLIPPAVSDYRGYYENVRDVLLGKARPAVTMDQALDVMRALQLGQESSERRCTVEWRS
jgi:scyllo-inositol 2-dehydrogenase (NADP+)